MITATYALSEHLASFEFFNWLVMVHADGARRICFNIENPKLKNFALGDVMRRFHTIVEPGPALAGLEYFQGDATRWRTSTNQLLPWFKSGRRFKRLQSVKPPVRCDYTVTLRNNTAGARSRDSNQDTWRKFAEAIGAVLIPDWYDKNIHLYDRLALYAGAKMNFGVCNGPIYMLSLTNYPVAQFVNGESARNSQIKWGTHPGEKYPWMLDNQHLVWKDDDSLDTLLRAFDKMKL